MRVRFHLPDFSGNFKLNLMFAEMLKHRPDLFREGVEIASFYGVFPPSIWNGGRTQGGMQCQQLKRYWHLSRIKNQIRFQRK